MLFCKFVLDTTGRGDLLPSMCGGRRERVLPDRLKIELQNSLPCHLKTSNPRLLF